MESCHLSRGQPSDRGRLKEEEEGGGEEEEEEEEEEVIDRYRIKYGFVANLL